MASVLARRTASFDFTLFNSTLSLLAVGLIMVFDASYALSLDQAQIGNDGYYYLKRQAICAGIGLCAMLLLMRYNYANLRAHSQWLLLLALLGLFAVWLPGIGVRINGANRWVDLGPIQLQPAEYAKLALAIYLAALLSAREYPIRSFSEGLVAPLLVVGVFVVLVEREPDLGTAAVIGLSSLAVLYIAGARKRHLLSICAATLALFILATIAFSHRTGRIKAFLNPEADYYGRGYQITRGLIAVGSGGVKGMGLGAGREKFYLPAANTDFIFATIAEETGLWGSVGVLGLLFVIGFRSFVIARNAPDLFGKLLAAGIGATISIQALINIAVVTGSIPATGVPLPFISYGGSSLVFLLASIGILLNIAQHTTGKTQRT